MFLFMPPYLETHGGVVRERAACKKVEKFTEKGKGVLSETL